MRSGAASDTGRELSPSARSSARTTTSTPTSLFSHSSRSRTYSADFSWSALTWIGIDASYSKLHLDTLSGIAYFFNNAFIDNDQSRYISNIHSGNIGVRVSAGTRVELFGGYVRTQDREATSRRSADSGFRLSSDVRFADGSSIRPSARKAPMECRISTLWL